MKNLNNYKTLKTELKKEINQKDFEYFKMKAYNSIKTNLSKNTKHTTGATPKYDSVTHFSTDEELCDVFGLPFTSSSSFAAFWNTNTTCETTEGKKIFFLAASMNLNNKIVLIFEDEQEEYYYFEDYEFSIYMEELKQLKKYKQAAEFNANANKAIKTTLEVFEKYEGKPYGEKTKEKIRSEVNEQIKKYNLFAYATINKYDDFITIINNKTRLQHTFYAKLFDSNNKIMKPELKSNLLEEFDSKKTYNKVKKLMPTIQEKSKKLLEDVEEYNKLKRLTQEENKDTQIFNYQLHSIAKYGLKD